MGEQDTAEDENREMQEFVDTIRPVAEGLEDRPINSLDSYSTKWKEALTISSNEMFTEEFKASITNSFSDALEEAMFNPFYEMQEETMANILQSIAIREERLAAAFQPITDMHTRLAIDAVQSIIDAQEELATAGSRFNQLGDGLKAVNAAFSKDIAQLSEIPIPEIRAEPAISAPSAPIPHSSVDRPTLTGTATRTRPSYSADIEPSRDISWGYSDWINVSVLCLCYIHDKMIEALDLEPAQEELERRRILLMFLAALAGYSMKKLL